MAMRQTPVAMQQPKARMPRRLCESPSSQQSCGSTCPQSSACLANAPGSGVQHVIEMVCSNCQLVRAAGAMVTQSRQALDFWSR